jgi:hypothetical protein
MKGLLVMLAAAVCAAVFAGGAGADRPLREFVPQADDTISGVCAFDVGLHVLANKGYQTTFSDGRIQVNGVLKFRLTNLTPGGKSIDVNVSGPGVITDTPDLFQIKAEGSWFWFFDPGDLGPGSPGMMLMTSGLTYLRADANGVTFTPARKTTDICAALA